MMDNSSNHKWIWILFSFLVFVGCSVPQIKRAPEVASPDAKKILEAAETDKASGKYNEALAKVREIVTNHQQTDIVDDAWFIAGDIYFENRTYDKAHESYLKIVESSLVSPLLGEAYLRASISLARQGKMDDVIKLTERALEADLSSKEMIPIYDLRLQALERKGEYLEVLQSLVYLASHHPDKKLQDRYRLRALEMVEGKLDLKQLEQVGRSGSFGFVRPYALYRKGELEVEDKQYDRAQSSFRGVKELIPESDLAARATDQIDQLKAIQEVDPYTIGVILPLSGRNAPIAQMTLRGIQMGLGLHQSGEQRFKLAIADSGGNPDIARKAVERLIREDSVVAIIGGILSKTSPAIAEKAQQLEVPYISLSQKSGVADIGPYVFRNALTGEMQVRQLVRSAMEDYGLKKFAILYPNDAYGTEFANMFWDEVLARGGEIRGAQIYSPKETDFKSHVQRLVGTFYVSDREQEYKLRLDKWMQNQGKRSARSKPPEDLLPPIVDFDAIFIPDGARAVGQIAPMLLYNNVKGVKLLGTNIWNTPELIRRGKNFVNGSLFVDTVMANDPRLSQSQFAQNYKAIFNEEPGIFEIQGYDSALILKQALVDGARTRSDVARSLSRLGQFPGALGTLKVQDNGEIDRPLLTLTITDQKIVPASGNKAR